jgi:hypothetical protein
MAVDWEFLLPIFHGYFRLLRLNARNTLLAVVALVSTGMISMRISQYLPFFKV